MVRGNKNLIGFCGLYCGDCFGYQGRIADLAVELRRELRQSKFEKTAEALSTISFFQTFKNYRECYDVLGALVKLRCKKACKGGGGPPFCKIRKCCQRKGIDGCWQCDEFETCDKLDFLRPVHGDAHLRNLRKIKQRGVSEFLKGKRHWYVKAKESPAQ